MKRILRLDSVLSFGKHKGKTVRQVFSGVQPIPQMDLAEMYFLYRGDSLGDGENESKLHAALNSRDWRELLPKGQRLLFNYQPHPSYIDWILSGTEDWFLDPIDLTQLQSESVLYLTKISPPSEENDWVLTPVFSSRQHRFKALTFTIAAERKALWVDEQDSAEDHNSASYDYGIDDHLGEFSFSRFCPACGAPSPCGCNYEMESFC